MNFKVENRKVVEDVIAELESASKGDTWKEFDIEFPLGQDQISYIVGQNTTMYEVGIIIKTTNGGDTWTQVSQAGIHGLTNFSFPTLQVGYAVG